MATSKPRITITLTDRQYQVLKSISDNSGQTMSGLVSGVVDTSMAMLVRMAATFQQMRKSEDAERARLEASMSDVQDAFEPLMMAAVAQQDLFLQHMIDEAEDKAVEDVERKAALSMLVAPYNPRTNRGVTPLRGKQLQASSGKALKPVLKKEVLKKVGASNEHKPDGCTCVVTKHERQENKTCPVHARRGARHAL